MKTEQNRGRQKADKPALPSAEAETFEMLDADIDRQIRTLEMDAFTLGHSLQRMKEGKLYKCKFKTWEEYVSRKADISRQHAHRLMKQCEVVGMLEKKMSPAGDVFLPTSGNQVEVIRKLKDPSDQVKAWKEAIGLAGGKQPAPSDIEEAVKKRLKAFERKGKKEEAVDAEVVGSEADDDTVTEGDDVGDAAPGVESGEPGADPTDPGSSGSETDGDHTGADAPESGEGPEEGVRSSEETAPPQETAPNQDEFAFAEEIGPTRAAARGLEPGLAGEIVMGPPGVNQGSGHEGWDDVELADGSLLPGALCPDGYMTVEMVRNGLRRLGRLEGGQNLKVALQQLLVDIARLVNETDRANSGMGSKMRGGIRRLFKEVLPNMRLE